MVGQRHHLKVQLCDKNSVASSPKNLGIQSNPRGLTERSCSCALWLGAHEQLQAGVLHPARVFLCSSLMFFDAVLPTLSASVS